MPVTVRAFPSQEQRVETGIVQFGQDWPGVFIRGDSALHYWSWLRPLVEKDRFVFRRTILGGLLWLLRHADVRTHDALQEIPAVPPSEPPPIDKATFAWAIERLCGESPPEDAVDGWLDGTDEDVELQHWVSESMCAQNVRAIDVIEAAEQIARGVDWK